MSDEALAILARDNDGRWSSQTKALLERFKTSKLDLNLPWAKTWVGWQCPCCKRDKPDIARLSRGGVLRCKLETHHDHLEDYVRRIFDDLNPSILGDAEHNGQRNIAKDGIIALTARFGRVLVCSDCNSAESEAKKNVAGIDQHFTFTPKEIAAFVVPIANRVHDLNVASAQQIWDATKSDFEDRVDFARRMARRFANGKNRQEIVRDTHDLSFHDSHYFWLKLIEANPGIAKRSLADLIEKRSVAGDGDGAFALGRPTAAHRPPSDAEFRLIEQRLPAGKEYWLGLGDHWQCECCKRNKREICRMSNRGEWTARIHKIRDWVIETDADNLAWRQTDATRSSLVMRAHRTVYVCQDCRNVVAKLRRLHPEVSEGALAPHDVAAVLVETRPNADHIVDYERALSLARANHELVLAAEDYDQHLKLLFAVKYQFKRQTTYRRKSANEAMEVVAESLVANGLTSGKHSVAYARWLVGESLRVQEIIEAERAILVKAA